jgi:hypothetical protein
MHEGFHHLLETHLLNEAVMVAICRNLHHEHPLRQLLAMVWVLSKPTPSTLLASGDSSAFGEGLCPAAAEAVAGFRRRLQQISEDIAHRNEGLSVPYTYLDPVTISRSTEI